MAAATAAAPPAVAGLGASLTQVLESVEPSLADVVRSIAASVAAIAGLLRETEDVSQAGSTNSFGDDQIAADILADEVIFRHLRACPAVESASSEEQSDILPMGGRGYTVAFDPLDGSSIFAANFAVGTIFGVWRGATPLGQTGRQQAAAAYSVYGPRTLLVLALPVPEQQQQQQCSSSGNAQEQQQQQQQQQQHPSQRFQVVEFALKEKEADWRLHAMHARLGSNSVVAPANIRAAKDNAEYEKLLLSWIGAGCKLRYSGGMVPDIHHILAKGGGVFCNPKSPSAPAKLRLLYECAPLSLIVEAAGGVSHTGHGSVLDLVISDTGARSTIAAGSGPRVEECLQAMRGG